MIIKRYGYIYYYDGKGEGTPKMSTEKEWDKTIHEFINFLYLIMIYYPKKIINHLLLNNYMNMIKFIKNKN